MNTVYNEALREFLNNVIINADYQPVVLPFKPIDLDLTEENLHSETTVTTAKAKLVSAETLYRVANGEELNEYVEGNPEKLTTNTRGSEGHFGKPHTLEKVKELELDAVVLIDNTPSTHALWLASQALSKQLNQYMANASDEVYALYNYLERDKYKEMTSLITASRKKLRGYLADPLNEHSNIARLVAFHSLHGKAQTFVDRYYDELQMYSSRPAETAEQMAEDYNHFLAQYQLAVHLYHLVALGLVFNSTEASQNYVQTILDDLSGISSTFTCCAARAFLDVDRAAGSRKIVSAQLRETYSLAADTLNAPAWNLIKQIATANRVQCLGVKNGQLLTFPKKHLQVG